MGGEGISGHGAAANCVIGTKLVRGRIKWTGVPAVRVYQCSNGAPFAVDMTTAYSATVRRGFVNTPCKIFGF